VDHKAGLDAAAERGNPIIAPAWNWGPCHPARGLVSILNEMPWLQEKFTVP
jgi:hypothetical protein